MLVDFGPVTSRKISYRGYLIFDLAITKIFTRPPLKAGPTQSEISTGVFIHISVYLITKFKILIYSKSEKLIYL